jgi:hypothetical protein
MFIIDSVKISIEDIKKPSDPKAMLVSNYKSLIKDMYNIDISMINISTIVDLSNQYKNIMDPNNKEALD